MKITSAPGRGARSGDHGAKAPKAESTEGRDHIVIVAKSAQRPIMDMIIRWHRRVCSEAVEGAAYGIGFPHEVGSVLPLDDSVAVIRERAECGPKIVVFRHRSSGGPPFTEFQMSHRC
jgi:hypothetical protein